MTLFQALCIASGVSLALYFFRNEFAQLFTDEEGGLDVSLAAAVIPLFSLSNLLDMCLSFIMGCVRALGIQANIAMISIAGFYLVSIPAACYLAFVENGGIFGLWIGYFLGIIIQVVIIAWRTFAVDW